MLSMYTTPTSYNTLSPADEMNLNYESKRERQRERENEGEEKQWGRGGAEGINEKRRGERKKKKERIESDG